MKCWWKNSQQIDVGITMVDWKGTWSITTKMQFDERRNSRGMSRLRNTQGILAESKPIETNHLKWQRVGKTSWNNNKETRCFSIRHKTEVSCRALYNGGRGCLLFLIYTLHRVGENVGKRWGKKKDAFFWELVAQLNHFELTCPWKEFLLCGSFPHLSKNGD